MAALVYGPAGLNKKKVAKFLSQDQVLIAQLADYADKTAQAEQLVATLSNSESSSASVNAALTGFAAYGIVAIGTALACRLVLQLQVDHTLGVRADRWWLGVARDFLAFGVHVASYFVSIVSWRDHRYRVRSDGTLIAIGGPTA